MRHEKGSPGAIKWTRAPKNGTRGEGGEPILAETRLHPRKISWRGCSHFQTPSTLTKGTGSPEIFLVEFHESNGIFIRLASVFPSPTCDAPRIEMHKTGAARLVRKRSVIDPPCTGKTRIWNRREYFVRYTEWNDNYSLDADFAAFTFLEEVWSNIFERSQWGTVSFLSENEKLRKGRKTSKRKISSSPRTKLDCKLWNFVEWFSFSYTVVVSRNLELPFEGTFAPISRLKIIAGFTIPFRNKP